MNTSFRTIACAVIAAMAAAGPALADRLLSGLEAQKLLSGQRVDFFCADGTRGEASYAHSGMATASYRLAGASMEAVLITDQGRVRVEGENVCIRWNNLNSGTEGCYQMTERRPGVYRIAEGRARWCDLSIRPVGDRAERN